MGVVRFTRIGFLHPISRPLCGTFEIACGLLCCWDYGRVAPIPLLIVITTAIATTKLPELFRANQGFWYMVSDARTDFAMLCSLLFLIFGGRWCVVARCECAAAEIFRGEFHERTGLESRRQFLKTNGHLELERLCSSRESLAPKRHLRRSRSQTSPLHRTSSDSADYTLRIQDVSHRDRAESDHLDDDIQRAVPRAAASLQGRAAGDRGRLQRDGHAGATPLARPEGAHRCGRSGRGRHAVHSRARQAANRHSRRSPAGFRFYHTHNRAGANLSAGQYSGQVGPVYIEPKHEPGSYDREVFLVLKEFEPTFSRGGDMAQDFLSPATRDQGARRDRRIGDEGFARQRDAARIRSRLRLVHHQWANARPRRADPREARRTSSVSHLERKRHGDSQPGAAGPLVSGGGARRQSGAESGDGSRALAGHRRAHLRHRGNEPPRRVDHGRSRRRRSAARHGHCRGIRRAPGQGAMDRAAAFQVELHALRESRRDCPRHRTRRST